MEDLSLYLLDIVYNSIRARATYIKIIIINKDIFKLRIEDNGIGMSEKEVHQVQNPFYTTRTTRKVGLGIPFLKLGALQTGGNFYLSSCENKGTIIEADFIKSHLDCPPIGDLSSSLVTLIQADENITFDIDYEDENHHFNLNTNTIKELLDGVPINLPEVIIFLKTYITEGMGL